jgi:hypothetical protein
VCGASLTVSLIASLFAFMARAASSIQASSWVLV